MKTEDRVFVSNFGDGRRVGCEQWKKGGSKQYGPKKPQAPEPVQKGESFCLQLCWFIAVGGFSMYAIAGVILCLLFIALPIETVAHELFHTAW